MNWQFYPVSEYDDYTSGWNQLNESNANNPLLSSDFVAPLLKYFSDDSEILAVCRDGDTIVAMAILMRMNFGTWYTFQRSQAPIGLWIQNNNIALENLLDGLLKSLSATAFILSLTQQDPDYLRRPGENNQRLATLDYIRTARITLEGSFEDYWSRRGKNLRQNLNRQRNRLKRETVETQLKIVASPDQVRTAVTEYGALESAGWKSQGGTAIHIDNSQGQFYEEMLTNFFQKNQGLIFQYLYNDEIVACDLCIMGSGSLIILKTTYDEKIKGSSPAMLMRQDAFAHVFNEKLVDRIEFYGKVMDWHTKWSSEIRTMYHANFYKFPILKKIKSLSGRNVLTRK